MGKLNYNVNNIDFFKLLFHLAKSKRKKMWEMVTQHYKIDP